MLKNQSTNYIFGLPEEQVNEIQAKYALLEPLFGDYLSPSQKKDYRIHVSQVLQISDRTLRRYLSKLKKKGMKGLLRTPRSDAGRYRLFSKAILDKALLLLEQNPFRSIPMLMKLMEADKDLKDRIKNISPSTLYHHLKKAGVSFKKKDDPKTNRFYRSFQAEYPNQLWQGDARHGITLPDPNNPHKRKMTYLFAWVDDFSRKIMHAAYYWDEKLPRMEDCFKHAVLRWGIPEKLYCDNGKVYRSNMFLFLVTDLGITKIHHPAYSAWCKGKIENIMKSFKRFQQEADLADFKTLEELNSALYAWIEVEYNNKIHSSTGETPHNRFRNKLSSHPPKRIKDLEKFLHMFFFRKQAAVNKYGKIRFNNNHYLIKGLPPQTKVELRFDPFDLSLIQVFYKNQFYSNLSASILTSKTLPSIPEESQKSEKTVSKEAVNYFTLLREKYAEQQRNAASQIHLSNIKQNNKKGDKQ